MMPFSGLNKVDRVRPGNKLYTTSGVQEVIFIILKGFVADN